MPWLMRRLDRWGVSLRRRVQFHVSILIVLVFLIFSMLTYVFEHDTIHHSQDRRLERIALSVPGSVKDADLRSINIKLTHGRDDFVLQIWHDGRQVYRSHEDVELARLARAGFSRQSWRGEGWISFCRLHGPLTIQVSQSLDAREALARERASYVIIPLLVLLPIAVMIIPMGVGRGLAPLQLLTDDLRRRDWRSLTPIAPKADGRAEAAELVPLRQALDRLLARLRDAATAQQAFIADASHELRTPLAALKILVQMLEEAPDDRARQAALSPLKEAILRATRLSEQLLVTSRLDADHAATRNESVSLRGLLEEAIIALSPFAATKAMNLSLIAPRDASIRADRVEVSLLVTNLIENAIRYTPRLGQVRVTLVKDVGCAAMVMVEDSGPGIAPGERTRVFDRFYRCPGADTPGSGLGLAIVAEVARRHGARIALGESALGGLQVQIHVPPRQSPDIGNSQC